VTVSPDAYDLEASGRMKRSVLVIILSFNCKADTRLCLESLQAQAVRDFDILVVDNHSTDGAPALLKAEFPQVEMVEMAENRGWAGGNNAGISLAMARGYGFVCLLNSDTVVTDGAIGTLRAAAQAIGPCLLHPAIAYADRSQGMQLSHETLGGGQRVEAFAPHRIFEMDHAYGACLFVDITIFQRIGLFDERFFLQLEETDFFCRAQRAGFRAYLAEAALIIHAESKSFGGSTTPVKLYYTTRNRCLLTEKHDATWRGYVALLRRTYWSLDKCNTSARRRSFWRWLFSSAPHARAARLALRDYALRRFGPIAAAARRRLEG
jgi:GT2 family glycosyltransferase